MYIPSPQYLSPGDNAWQLTAATFVGMQTVPGLAILYGGLVKKKWAINSAMMVVYAFSIVLISWVLWGYSMGFGNPLKLGPGILSGIVGIPHPVLGSLAEQGQASIPLLNGLMPSFRFPGATLIFFQFVFAAITPAILAGGVLGRMNWKAWMLFVPIWSTLVYSINAFMLWGGGWLSQLGAVDYSGGYVIHVAAGISGFVAAAVVGPRLVKDREDFSANNLLMALAGAGILWLGWNGFNGGDPYFANADAAAAVLNTNLATAAALVSWLVLDMWKMEKPSLIGMINGMVCGLVAITPAAGYVTGVGAILVGIFGAAIPWYTMNRLGTKGIFAKVDDTLGVFHTHAVAGAVGGLMTGLLADPAMSEYLGVKTSNVSVTGLFYGNPHQFVVQLEALLVILLYDGLMTWGILKVIGLVVPLRMKEAQLIDGDHAIARDITPDPLPPAAPRHPEASPMPGYAFTPTE
ncbi:ammonium transporter [Sulfobacillus acidophilus TPY]|uniref:Ammonium transporter n=1 Tax=Sulfobacillus acidophilus (strain ATCC 700253 / DSM 10332 / NAL) TaxID=679936 RepID=G8TVB7_SULAD|nr:ammonium transporter [Sulfobacillus acidophilus TPY]AEW04757.1 ammonium transporter [Sulfobacillus acidophilus DSM 10332]